MNASHVSNRFQFAGAKRCVLSPHGHGGISIRIENDARMYSATFDPEIAQASDLYFLVMKTLREFEATGPAPKNFSPGPTPKHIGPRFPCEISACKWGFTYAHHHPDGAARSDAWESVQDHLGDRATCRNCPPIAIDNVQGLVEGAQQGHLDRGLGVTVGQWRTADLLPAVKNPFDIRFYRKPPEPGRTETM